MAAFGEELRVLFLVFFNPSTLFLEVCGLLKFSKLASMDRVFNRIDQSTLMICEYSAYGGKYKSR